LNPEEFFKTAEKLKDSDKEPDLRTSMGRSYYAVFLYFRDYLFELGLVPKIKNHEPHKFVLSCMSNSRVKEAQSLSTKLVELKQKRTKADYDLKIKVTNTEAEDVLEDAKEAIATFNSLMTPDKQNTLVVNTKQFAENWPRGC